jgi:hypothetical protein
MRKVAVDGSLARWQRLLLALGVLVAAWGPAHSAEVAVPEHSVEGLAHAHSTGTHGAGSRDAVSYGLESLGVYQEPGEHDEPRCGHRDAERDATQATSVRLPQPDAANSLLVAASGDGKSPRALTDVREPRAPPGQMLFVVVCVWRR